MARPKTSTVPSAMHRPAEARGSAQSSNQKKEVGSVPSIVLDVLSELGQPLDAGTRAYFEPRFGADFGDVRVHTGSKAASSAATVSADAYTYGHQIVLGKQLTRSESHRLLAHELVHVQQADDSQANVPHALSSPHDAAEKEADVIGRSVLSPAAESDRVRVASHNSEPNTIRRSIMGSILSGVGGALAGGLAGGLIGGPIGAIVGAVAGAAAGTVLGNELTTRERHLDPAKEIPYAKEIFADSIKYPIITITRDSVLSLGAPKTIGNTIHLRSDWGHFKDAGMELTDLGLQTLIHEMGHVWQYQNGGLDYIPQSLIAQFGAFVSGGTRGAAYNWKSQIAAGIPWEKWNPEQQAQAIEDYNIALRRVKNGKALPNDFQQLSILLPYIEKVRRKEGAP